MNWFRDLKTGTKLLLGFGVMIVLLGVTVVTSYNTITALRDSQQELFERNFTSMVDMVELRADQNRQRAQILDMTLTTDRSRLDNIAQDIRSRVKEIDASLQRLSEYHKNNPGTLLRIEEMKSLLDAYRQTRDTQVALIFDGKVEEARQTAESVQNDRAEKIRTISVELGKDMYDQTRREIATSFQLTEQSLRLFVILGGLALLAGMAMTVVLNRLISRPLTEISGAAEKIATGDLTVKVTADGRMDEVGVLARTFSLMTRSLQEIAGVARQIAENDLRVQIKPQSEKDVLGNAFATMTSNLRRTTSELAEGVNVLAASASEILAATTQVASSAAETGTAITQTTTTVEEVKQTAQVSSQKARYVSDSAQKATQVAQSGRKSVEASIEGMQRIQEQMESIAESVVRLSEQGQAIGEIIASVNDLAEQSNLLAVNAAIEAAKAGEQGKGFAVVAQEVKSLAEQSRQATAQVRSILNDIQKATTAAVLATEQGSKAVDAGVRQSTEAGEAIRLLADSITEAAQAATQIAASSQQQMVGMDQMAQAMENIKQASIQNVAGTRQAEAAAHNLHELGQKLKQLVEQYK